MAGFFAEPFFNNNFFKTPFFNRNWHPFFAEPFFNDIATSFAISAEATVSLNDIIIVFDKPLTGVLRDEDFKCIKNGVVTPIHGVTDQGQLHIELLLVDTFVLSDHITVQIVPHLDNNLGELAHSQVEVVA